MVPIGAGPLRILTTILVVALPGASQAADSGELRSRGKTLLQDNCSRCHAIEAKGDSPLQGAPPMRTIYARFAPKELQAELREGMGVQASGHAADRFFRRGYGCDPGLSLCAVAWRMTLHCCGQA